MKKYVQSSTMSKTDYLNDVSKSVMDLEDKLEYLWKYVMNNDKDSDLVVESLKLYNTLMRYNDYVRWEWEKETGNRGF